jgi:hypothetical protein
LRDNSIKELPAAHATAGRNEKLYSATFKPQTLLQPSGASAHKQSGLWHRPGISSWAESANMLSTFCQAFRVLFVVSAACLLAACSYSSDFVIVNESDSPVEVRYQLKAYDPSYHESYNEKFIYPALMSAEDLKRSSHEWKQLNEAGKDFGFDEKSGTVSYQLPPQTALRVERILNYVDNGHNETPFRISNISLNGPKGSVELRGRQAQFAFKGDPSGTYIITYR